MKKHLFAILIASTLTLGGCSLVAPLSMIDNYRPSTPTSYSTSATPWWISSTTSTPWWISTSESTSTPWWVSTSESTSTPWWVSTSEPTSEPTSTPWWVSTSSSSGESFTSLSTTTSPYSSYYEISLDNLGTSNYPWVYDGENYKSTNEGIELSLSTMRISFKAYGTFSFEYKSYAEGGYDYLSVDYYPTSTSVSPTMVIDTPLSVDQFFSHELDVDEGSYLEFCFRKDGSSNVNDDCAMIRNLYFEPSPSPSTSEYTSTPWASSESTSDSSSPSGDSYEISLDNEGYSKDYPWSYDGYEFKSTNENVDSSESVMRITFKETGTFSFYYMCYCESGCDYLYITHYYYWSGSWGYVLESSASSPDYYDVEVYVESGDYLEFGYHKDGSVSNYDDCAKITNLSFSYSY